MANDSLTIHTIRFFGSFLKSPIQMGWLSIMNSVTNISRLGTFKIAKLACDQLCQRTLHILQHFASEHCSYGSKLLAHTVHAVAKSCKIVFFASVCCACGNTLLAHTALTVANCYLMLCTWWQFASVCCAYGSNCQRTLCKCAYSNKSSNILCLASVCCACGSQLLAYAAHAVPIASVCCACGSNLLA